MFRSLKSGVAAAVLLALSAFGAGAQTIYTGFDSAGPGVARPISDAAHAGFQADAGALGGIQTLDFESQAITINPVLTPSPNVTITFSGQFPTVNTVSNSNAQNFGFNTTLGGSNFLQVFPATLGTTTEDVSFAFTAPVQAFGAYFTGLETSFGVEAILFNNGVLQTYVLTGSGVGGGVTFFGFTNPGASISQVIIREIPNPGVRDLFGIDDVQFVNTSVPEPSMYALLASMSLSGASFLVRRKSRRKSAL